MQVILGADGPNRDGLGEWAAQRIRGYRLPKEYVAIGVSNGVRGHGVVIYHSHAPDVPDIHMDAAGDGLWLTRESLRVLFSYPFVQLGCRRITTIVAKKHKRARAFNEKLGFTQEGVCRKAMPNGDNAIIYGMLRDECRWIGD